MRKKILVILSFICVFGMGTAIGSFVTAKVLINIAEEYKKSSDKFRKLFRLMYQWIELKQKGKSLDSYFKKYNYNSIAIYGMGNIGDTLIKELSGTDIDIKYAIDQKYDRKDKAFVVSPDSILEKVDVIVVTVVDAYGEIKLRLKEKIDYPVISIEDILNEV